MNINVCKMGLGGCGVADGDEDSPLKSEERPRAHLDLGRASVMSPWYGRWPIGDRPRGRILGDWELDLHFNPTGGAGAGAGTGADGASSAGGASGTGGDTCARV